MLKRKPEAEVDNTQDQVSLQEFLKGYNESIPKDFLRASVPKLKEFQEAYPALFKHGDTWSVAQHRKRVMDWLSSQKEAS